MTADEQASCMEAKRWNWTSRDHRELRPCQLRVLESSTDKENPGRLPFIWRRFVRPHRLIINHPPQPVQVFEAYPSLPK